VHAKVARGCWVWCGVEDAGGPWHKRPRDPGRMHGLDIVSTLAGRGCWGTVPEAGGRLVWFRLGWQPGAASRVSAAP